MIINNTQRHVFKLLSVVSLLSVISVQSAVHVVESNTSHNISENHSGHINGSHTEHENEEENLRFKVAVVNFGHVAAPFTIAAVIVCASLAKIGFHLNNKLSSIFPESCLLIVIGVILGIILYFSNVTNYQMDTSTFFLFLLPPIVLEAGYFMPVRSFFDNIGSILMFAVVGTLWNTLLIGLSIWGLTLSGVGSTGEINILHCFVFSALISAVDPVAVIAVFEEIHVNEILFIVVFGESLLNDAVTVVLYHMFEALSEIKQENIIIEDVVLGFVSFFLVSVGGTFIGLVYGFVASFITRFTDHVRVIEPLLVYCMGYLSYLTAEIFHLSGILACVFCGMIMNKYVERNISQKSHTTIKYFMKTMATVCETIIFMFLGISTVTKNHMWETGFILFTLFCCLLYRALGVIIFTWLLNRKRLIPISKVDQFIMAYGGLRGAIAYALVELLNDHTFPQKKLFVTTCVVVIYFTVFIQGSTIKPLVNFLHVKTTNKHKPSMNEKLNARLIDHVTAGIEDISGMQGHNELRERYKRINDKYIKPVLIRDKTKITRGRSILNVYQKLAERDAQLYLQKNGSFSSEFVKPGDLSRTSSLAHLFQQYSLAGQDYSFNNELRQDGNSTGIPMPSNLSSTVLDMRALEVTPTATIHKDDSQIHHMLEDNLFKTRRKFDKYQKQMLPESDIQKPFHHKARLHLRRLASPRHVKNGCKKSDVAQSDNFLTPNHAMRPRKNVSFANNNVTICVHEATPEGKRRKDDDSGSEDGIYFTVKSQEDPKEPDSPDPVPNEPTVAETTLPWKCENTCTPLSSTRFSLPNLQDLQDIVHEPIFVENKNEKDDKKPLIIAPSDTNNIEGHTNYALNDKGYHIEPTNPASNPSTPSVLIDNSVDPEMFNKQIDNEALTKTATEGSDEEEKEGKLPLPWKSEPSDTELSHVQDSVQPASYRLKPMPGDKSKQDQSPDDAQDFVSPIPPPWKNNGNGESSEQDAGVVMQSTPFTDETAVKTEVEDDREGERAIQCTIPPPWRQLSDSSMDYIRSPSVACTLDSMRPNPSSHSFHISEAESHHSQHLHMQHLIEVPSHPPQNNYEHECDVSDTELDLEQDQFESDEMVAHWILGCEPDIDLPVDDQEFDVSQAAVDVVLLKSMSDCTTTTTDKQNKSESSNV